MDAQSPQIVILQNQEEQDGEINLKDYWTALTRRWRLILIIFVIAVGLTVVCLVKLTRYYEATAVVKIPISGGGGGLAAALGAFLPIGASSDVVTEVEVIKGRDIAENVIRNLGLDKKKENLELDWRRIVSRFQRILRVGRKGQTNLIWITAISNSSEEAKNIANAVAEEYILLSDISRQKIWDELISQMDNELNQVRAELERSRQLLHKYEAGEGITTSFGSLLLGGGSTTKEYATPYMIPDVPQAVASLKADIMGMEVQLEAMLKTVSEADPRVINLKNQIAASKQKLQQEEKKAVEKYNKQFGLTNVAAEVVFNQQLYSVLVSKQEELKAQYIMQKKSPEVVEKAIEPLYPSKPKRGLVLMIGIVLGAFLSFGLALFREYMDKSMHNAESITRVIGIPVLGSIPYLSRASRRLHGSALIGGVNLTLNNRIRGFYEESYVILQLEVMTAVKKKTAHADNIQNPIGLALLVTSSVPGEGRSTVSANLAISMAQTGKKVLLVDADFRDPVLHKLMNLDIQTGLMDFLTGNTAWDDIIKSTTLSNLYVIAAGDKSGQSIPYSLLISSRMKDFLRLSREQFDVIVFDSPPAATASESAAIGSEMDGVLLVVKANDTHRDFIFTAKQRIQNSDGNIFGAVLNCAKVKRKYRRYYIASKATV